MHRRCGKNGGGSIYVFLVCFHGAARGATCFFSRYKMVTTLIRKSALATIDLRFRHTIHPRPTRFVSGKPKAWKWRQWRYQVVPWSRGREVASGVLRSSPKPEKKCLLFLLFVIGKGPTCFVAYFLHTSSNIFFISRLVSARRITPAAVWILWT